MPSFRLALSIAIDCFGLIGAPWENGGIFMGGTSKHPNILLSSYTYTPYIYSKIYYLF